jgi:hypothetical protein
MDNMREDDWKAVQAEWDAFEKHWPEIEKMSSNLGTEIPDKIPLRPFKTPFGEMKGGYAPIGYDPRTSKQALKAGNLIPDPERSLDSLKPYKATTTTNGGLNNRIEGYTDRVNLDYHYVTRRMNETIHDLAYREVLLNARKIINHPDFRQQFMQTFGREEYAGLTKWLDNIRDMVAGDQAQGAFQRNMAAFRRNVVATGVAFRATTVIKHGVSASLKSAGYLSGGGEKYLAARVARMGTGNLNADIQDAMQKFPEIRTRMQRMDRDLRQPLTTLYEGDGFHAKADRFGHAAVAWVDALSAIPTAHAAYDWATTEGIPESLGGTGEPMTHEAAIRYANKVVREAHGSANEASMSNLLNNRDTLMRTMTMVFGFANNSYGQTTDIWDKFVAPNSKMQDKPVLLAKAFVVSLMPSLFGFWMAHGKEDKESWAGYMAKAIAGTYAETVPIVREAYDSLMSIMAGHEPRPTEAPVYRALTAALQVPYDAMTKKYTKIVADMFDAIGYATGIPGMGQLGKTAQYATNMATGKEKPKSAMEAVEGLTIGVHKTK